jgi:dTDP-L-rhamnose 4-epimerase
MQKILITGGLGFIGTTLARQLLSAGHDVTLLDSLSAQIHGDLPNVAVPAGARFIRLDVRDIADHAPLLEGMDSIYHLAAETGTAQSMYQIRHYVGVNELGTAALFEAIAKCTRRPTRLVLASSRSIYGEGAYRSEAQPGAMLQPEPRGKEQLAQARWEFTDDAGRPLHAIATPETLPPAPGSVYAATKMAQEMLVRTASLSVGLKTTILRFQNVYGEGQSLRNPYTGIISIFFNRIRQGLDIPIYEDGHESRDFVHVDDVVRALQRSIEADLPNNAVINVGAGVPTSVLALSETLRRASGFDAPVRITGQYRVGDIRHCYADLARLESLMGLRPTVSLDEGLARFCDWARTQPVHVDQLEAATAVLREKGLSNP